MKTHILWCFAIIVVVGANRAVEPQDPDESLTFVDYVKRHGFGCESHEVMTKDGYILVVHRLTSPGESEEVTRQRRPVLLQHGLLGSSLDFVINSPFVHAPNTSDPSMGDNLAFDLHLTARYDVWLGNSRGNKYSNRHVKYTPRDRAFWQFSFDHMAMYDLPATIHHIRNVTSQPTVGYIGFSQGTTIMFALLSLQPEYARIVRPFVAMAPVAFLAQIKSPIKYLVSIEPLFRKLGGQFLPSEKLIRKISQNFCEESEPICKNIIFLFSGFDAQHLNETRLPVYLSYVPSPTSTWDVCHFAQNIESKRFARFNYGSKGNVQHYGRQVAPDYPLEHIPSDAKIALFRGLNDYLASTPDIDNLKRIFVKSNVTLIEDYVVPVKSWAHTDFIFGTQAGRLLYHRVIQVLDRYVEHVESY